MCRKIDGRRLPLRLPLHAAALNHYRPLHKSKPIRVPNLPSHRTKGLLKVRERLCTIPATDRTLSACMTAVMWLSHKLSRNAIKLTNFRNQDDADSAFTYWESSGRPSDSVAGLRGADVVKDWCQSGLLQVSDPTVRIFCGTELVPMNSFNDSTAVSTPIHAPVIIYLMQSPVRGCLFPAVDVPDISSVEDSLFSAVILITVVVCSGAAAGLGFWRQRNMWCTHEDTHREDWSLELSSEQPELPVCLLFGLTSPARGCHSGDNLPYGVPTQTHRETDDWSNLYDPELRSELPELARGCNSGDNLPHGGPTETPTETTGPVCACARLSRTDSGNAVQWAGWVHTPGRISAVHSAVGVRYVATRLQWACVHTKRAATGKGGRAWRVRNGNGEVCEVQVDETPKPYACAPRKGERVGCSCCGGVGLSRQRTRDEVEGRKQGAQGKRGARVESEHREGLQGGKEEERVSR
ncbi:hypothetical protein DFH09DRAFT_1075866 [Mycena vulgaris]|nr:hypothetical protein DFH09DRAFT_1075866 [Mycena vulgaris]